MELLAVSERCLQHYPKIQYYEYELSRLSNTLQTTFNANTLGGGLSYLRSLCVFVGEYKLK